MPESGGEKPKRPTHVGEVLSIERLTPRMVRMVLGGAGLAKFEAGRCTDHYVKVQLPPPDAPYAAPFEIESVKAELPRESWPRTRSITVRYWDAARRLLTLDFVDHGPAGFAGPWAAAARVGDRLQMLGPGGDYAPDPGADWHLMVGDDAALPAIAASLERIPAGVPVYAVVAVDDPRDRLELDCAGRLDLRWIFRDAAGDTTGSVPTRADLPSTVRALSLPDGHGQAFVHGEAEMVRTVRRHLLIERRMSREALSASGYWKRDRSDEAWRAEKPEWKRLAEADLAA